MMASTRPTAIPAFAPDDRPWWLVVLVDLEGLAVDVVVLVDALEPDDDVELVNVVVAEDVAVLVLPVVILKYCEWKSAVAVGLVLL